MTLHTREDLERLEDLRLAPYACRSAKSLGRDVKEGPDPLRMAYQRDRDRIIHSSAFRKLERKTQVFLPFESDYPRNRLTHTMEVAQIARSMARNLGLNEDLAEAIALAHDLGHPPFGHAGEEALQRKMAEHGGFEHNEQGLRVVEKLERRYVDRPGLNLSWEVREGIAKHRTAYDKPSLARFDPDRQPSLEAQICDLADEIAYNHHDLDDALSLDLIEEDDLKSFPWLWEIWGASIRARGGRARDRAVRFHAIGALFDQAVGDVLKETARNIAESGIRILDDVRRAGRQIAGFSAETGERYKELRDFLMRYVYRHPQVVRNTTKAEHFISSLFDLYARVPEQMPRDYQARIEDEGLERVICDYIAGMTDRYCQEEYRNSFEPQMIR